MQQLTDKAIPEPVNETFDLIQFQKLLTRLNLLAPLCKEKLIHVCLMAIEDDGQITPSEAEVIRAIAACLNCPIPPVLSSVS
jgi:hypothetical protein